MKLFVAEYHRAVCIRTGCTRTILLPVRALHVDLVAGRRTMSHTAKNTLAYLPHEYVMFIEPPSMWPRIAQLRCLECPSTNGVMPATTDFGQRAFAGSQRFVDRAVNEIVK